MNPTEKRLKSIVGILVLVIVALLVTFAYVLRKDPRFSQGEVRKPEIEQSVTELKTQDEKLGEKDEASVGKTVTVHYIGMLTNGTVFDSSIARAQPLKFHLGKGEVIKGWDNGIEGMKLGGKRKLWIPPDLAYGAKGVPGVIPPNATLVFHIELLKVE